MFKNSRMRKAVVATVGVAAAGGILLAASMRAAAAPEYPKPIQDAVNSGVEIVKTFPAASGLKGWVLSQGGKYSIVYTTGDGKTVVVGTLLSENGEDLSAEYEDRHVPKPDFSALFKDLEQSAYVVEGTVKNPKSVVYAFADANCPFCHMAWKALQPYEKAGLQVRWILVDTLGPTSMPKAIEVLAAPDKMTAFRRMEEGFGKPWKESAGMTAADKPKIAERVKANNTLLGKFGFGGTPSFVWTDKEGKVQMKSGMPRLAELPGMTGLPEQKIDDPDLDRFR
jgi:thiol:disulfide interchange protein DsbG